MNTSLIGKWGEAKAIEYLKKNHFNILAVNYRTRFGEIDIIAKKRKIVAFVEVKLRKSSTYAAAREFVSYSKCEKIKACAQLWLVKNGIRYQPRFDVIEIYAPNGIEGKVDIEHIENAFT